MMVSDNLCLPKGSGNNPFTLVVQPQYYNAAGATDPGRSDTGEMVPGPHSSSDPGLLAGAAVIVIMLVLAVVCIVVLFIWWR